MGLDGRQIFVWETSVDRVSGLIRRYVEKVGSAAAVYLDSEKPTPEMAGRTQREFTLSDARNGIFAIWEDGCWADRKLARYLSKELETRTIWLALATLSGEWAYVVYANGAVADSHTHTTETIEELEMMETTERIYAEACEFSRRHTLPFALIYLPDPSLPAKYELAKKAFQDLLALTPELEGRVEVDYQLQDEDLQPEDLVETEAEVEVLKRQRAEIAKFPKLTIRCK